MLELTIKGNSPAELFTQITGLYGMLHAARVAAPAQVQVEAIANPAPETTTNPAPQTDAPAAEKVDPPRKPGRPKKTPESIDLKANLEQSIAETPAAEPQPEPTPVPEAPKADAKPLARDEVQKRFLELLNDVRVSTQDDAQMAVTKNAVFARLAPPLAEPKLKNVPDERLGELSAAIDAERAARLPEV